MECVMNKTTRFHWFEYLILQAAVMICVLPLSAQSAPTGKGGDTAAAKNVAEIAEVGAADVETGNTTTGKPHDPSYIIGADDVLAINVWKEPEISRTVPV